MAELIPEVRIVVQLKDRIRELEAVLTEIAGDLQYLAAWDIARKALDRKGEPAK